MPTAEHRVIEGRLCRRSDRVGSSFVRARSRRSLKSQARRLLGAKGDLSLGHFTASLARLDVDQVQERCHDHRHDETNTQRYLHRLDRPHMHVAVMDTPILLGDIAIAAAGEQS